MGILVAIVVWAIVSFFTGDWCYSSVVSGLVVGALAETLNG